MTLQQKLERVGAALAAAVPNVWHYRRPQTEPPFGEWAEDGEDGALHVDNKKAEQAIGGYVDYYTLAEYDPALDAIQEALKGITEFPFTWWLDSVQYEDETNLIHYQWEWSMA